MNAGSLNPMALMKLTKFLTVRSDALTPETVGEIASALGHPINVGDAMFTEVVETLRGGNVEVLSDVLGRPEMLTKLTGIFTTRAVGGDDNLIVCPHCGEYINPQA